jgi:hypothetical protein
LEINGSVVVGGGAAAAASGGAAAAAGAGGSSISNIGFIVTHTKWPSEGSCHSPKKQTRNAAAKENRMR